MIMMMMMTPDSHPVGWVLRADAVGVRGRQLGQAAGDSDGGADGAAGTAARPGGARAGG